MKEVDLCLRQDSCYEELLTLIDLYCYRFKFMHKFA